MMMLMLVPTVFGAVPQVDTVRVGDIDSYYTNQTLIAYLNSSDADADRLQYEYIIYVNDTVYKHFDFNTSLWEYPLAETYTFNTPTSAEATYDMFYNIQYQYLNSTSLWEIQYGYNATSGQVIHKNVTISEDCWAYNQTHLNLRFSSEYYVGVNVSTVPQCYNGTQWNNVFDKTEYSGSVSVSSGDGSALITDGIFTTASGQAGIWFYNSAIPNLRGWLKQQSNTTETAYASIYEESFWLNRTFNESVEYNYFNISSDLTHRFANWTFSIRSYDGVDYSAWSNFTVTINNTPPDFLQIIDQEVVVGNDLNITATCSDIDSDTLFYYDNTTLFDINETSGFIDDTPTVGEIGEYVIQISCSDGYINSTDLFTYSIRNASVPVIQYINYSPSSVQSNDTINFYTNISDADNDNITYFFKIYQNDLVILDYNSTYERYQENPDTYQVIEGNWTANYTIDFSYNTQVYTKHTSLEDPKNNTIPRDCINADGLLQMTYISDSRYSVSEVFQIWCYNYTSSTHSLVDIPSNQNNFGGGYTSHDTANPFDADLNTRVTWINSFTDYRAWSDTRSTQFYEEAMYWDTYTEFEQSKEINLYNLSAQNFSLDDTIVISVRAYDGEYYTNWLNSSEITISDATAPNINSQSLSSTSINYGDVATVIVNTNDTLSNISEVIVYFNNTLDSDIDIKTSNSAFSGEEWRVTFTPTGNNRDYTITNITAVDYYGNRKTLFAVQDFNLSFSVSTATTPSSSGGGGGGGSVQLPKMNPIIDYGTLSRTITIFSTPNVGEQYILIKNIGEDLFKGTIYVSKNLTEYVEVSVCDIDRLNCNVGTEIASGKNAIVKIAYDVPQGFEFSEGLISMEDGGGDVFELPLQLNRPPGYQLLKTVQEKPQETFIVMAGVIVAFALLSM